MYRRYYSINDMPKIVPDCHEKPKKCEETKVEEVKCQEEKCTPQKCENKKFFGNLELDDVILGIVILAILLDDADDTLLLLALFAVFFSGAI